MLKNCAANRKRRISALPNLGPYVPGVYKRIVRFQKLTRKFFLTLHGFKRTPSVAETVHIFYALIIILQCVHSGSYDTHPHDNRIRPI
jgi:hypothetical protein